MKYENIDPRNKLNENEPYFFLRAQDILSVATLYEYRHILFIRGLDTTSIEKVINEFQNWQSNNLGKIKLPD